MVHKTEGMQLLTQGTNMSWQGRQDHHRHDTGQPAQLRTILAKTLCLSRGLGSSSLL